MNTLVLDLQRLISNHLTTVEDVFLNHCDKDNLGSIKRAARNCDWKAILYYVQRYEYQRQTLNEIYWFVRQSNNIKLMNLFQNRYDLDVNKIVVFRRFVGMSDNKMKMSDLYNLLDMITIKSRWNIRLRDLKWLFGSSEVVIPEILKNILTIKDFDKVSQTMLEYCINKPEDYHRIIRFWATVLALSNRHNKLVEFMVFQELLVYGDDDLSEINKHNQTINRLIILACIRTDNSELFTKFFQPNKSNMDDALSAMIHFNAFKILKYTLETYNPKTYTRPYSTRTISDPRIVRMLVNQKELEIRKLDELIDNCEKGDYNVVAKVLSTLKTQN